jgi:hypothetical protein
MGYIVTERLAAGIKLGQSVPWDRCSGLGYLSCSRRCITSLSIELLETAGVDNHRLDRRPLPRRRGGCQLRQIPLQGSRLGREALDRRPKSLGKWRLAPRQHNASSSEECKAVLADLEPSRDASGLSRGCPTVNRNIRCTHDWPSEGLSRRILLRVESLYSQMPPLAKRASARVVWWKDFDGQQFRNQHRTNGATVS